MHTTYTDLSLAQDLRSQDPAIVGKALSHIIWQELETLSEIMPDQFGGVASAVAETLKTPLKDINLADALAIFPQNQQRVQFSSSFYDLSLANDLSFQIALENKQRLSHHSLRGASPRTPIGVLMDWAEDGNSPEQTLRLNAMREARWRNVDTGHPTESKAPPKVARLNSLHEFLSRPELNENDLPEARRRAREFLTTQSQFSNPDNNNVKTVIQEIEDQVITLKNKIHAIPAVVRDLTRAARGITLTNPALDPGHWINQRMVDLESWVGGDRDGNVKITAAETEYAAQRYNQVGHQVLIEYLHKLEAQLIKISLDDQVEIVQELREGLANDPDYSPAYVRTTLGRTFAALVDDSAQPVRQHLEDTLIILNSLDNHDHISAAQMHIRQDAHVMAALVSEMLGPEYAAMNDDDKTLFLTRLLEEPNGLEARFDKLHQKLTEQHNANPNDEKLKVRMDMANTLKLLPKYPSAWNLFIIANCGDGLQGSPLAKGRHVFEAQLLLTAVKADHILNIAQLFESKQQLIDAGPVTSALLKQPVFEKFLAKHKYHYVQMTALSDTTRQHGIGIRWYQEEATTNVAMATLETNAGRPREKWFRYVAFHGGGTSTTRGGRDPASWMYSLARKFRARAISQMNEQGERTYSDEQIAGTIAPICMQTRQGRAVTSRYYGTIASSRAHLGEMVANTMNFSRFLAAKPDKVNDEKLIAEDLADQRAKPFFDRAIAAYEEYFAHTMNRFAEEVTPWSAVDVLNISSRAKARNKSQASSLTGVRAITQKSAVQLSGGYDNAWFGIGDALAPMPLQERREMVRDSRLANEAILFTLHNCQRTDIECEYRLLNEQQPLFFPCEEYQKSKALSARAVAEAPILEVLRWKDVKFRETAALAAETLYGDPAARNLTPAQAMRPFGRLSLEAHEQDHFTRIARRLMIDAGQINADGQNATLQQIEANFARCTFDGMSTAHGLLSPGFGHDEYRMHELLGMMSRNGKIPGSIRLRHGASSKNTPRKTWPVYAP